MSSVEQAIRVVEKLTPMEANDLLVWLAERHVQGHEAREAEFRRLADQWYRETGKYSMVHKKAMHPAYQRIIGMGKEALPLIFKELQDRGGHWLWALVSITGHDAASTQQNYREAVAAWIDWGKKHGYF